MRVKRYLVDSMPDALEKIRSELGKDAVILNTKQVKTGGFLGFFGKQQIEVIAAVDAKAKESTQEAVRKVERPSLTANPVAAKKAYQQKEYDFNQMLTESAVGIVDRPSTTTQLHEKKKPVLAEESSIVSTAALATPVSSTNDNSSSVQYKEIATELKDMREMFKLLLLKQVSDNLPAAFLALRDRLVAQGVDEEINSHIMQELLSQMEEPHKVNEQEVFGEAAKILLPMLGGKTTKPARISRHIKYAFFFGPTGVGKTTTIAKLAAECMLKEKRKIGFITSDTYRIAAVDQLKTYANILNVPLEVVFSSKEFEQAVERLHGCDLIIVDTAGRNYRNNEYVEGMKEFLRFGETSENYLVLSLTSKYEDMKTIITNFRDAPVEKVIFTKSDETDAYGSILNIIHSSHLSLSYMTTGQNVPDDFVVATPEMVTNLILGEDTYA